MGHMARFAMNASDPIYIELVDFVAGGLLTPEDVIHFHPSAEAQQRVSELIEREARIAVDPGRNLPSWLIF